MSIRRRSVLFGMAGSAAAIATGCRTPPPSVRKRFVGQSPERGHLLREAAAIDRPPSDRITAPVVIVGGGAAGMAAAWRLAKAGVPDVRVLELESDTGGTSRAGEHERSRYPMGAHYLPAPPRSLVGLRALLYELGVILQGHDDDEPDYDPRYVCRAPVERHRAQGRWHEGLYPGFGQSEDDEATWQAWQSHLRSLDDRRGADGRRLFELPVDRSSAELRALDRISMAAYLDRLGLVGERLRWTIDYACRDDYGCTIEQTSAFAALHHFVARGVEDERDRMLLTWPQGNAFLVDGMRANSALHDRLHTDTLVFAIDPDTGVIKAWDATNDRVVQLHAQVVLWAAPRFVLRHVLPPGTDPLPADALTYAPWLVANVEVKKPPAGIGAPLSWDNVPTDRDDLGYVVATHLQSQQAATRPGAVLTFYQPLPAADADGLRARRSELLSGSLDAWCDHVVERLAHLHPNIAADIVAIDVARWGHAMVRPAVGHLFGDALAMARAPRGRVIPCAADVAGLPLFEEAFCSGVRAAETALARLGRAEATIL